MLRTPMRSVVLSWMGLAGIHEEEGDILNGKGGMPICLTYCVPFTVSMYSQVQAKRQRDLSLTKRSVPDERRELETVQREQLELSHESD